MLFRSGACPLIKSEYFEEIGGFDKNIFMYCEDVDLSFRAWLAGHKCLYVPFARVLHISQYFDPNKDLSSEFYYSRLYTLYILRKYFSEDDVERYIREKINGISSDIKDKIIMEFEGIKNYDLSVREKLPHPRIKLYSDFTFAKKRWEI